LFTVDVRSDVTVGRESDKQSLHLILLICVQWEMRSPAYLVGSPGLHKDVDAEMAKSFWKK